MFDYFNLIHQEYAMSLDKWGTDEDYLKQIKEGQAEIDKDRAADEQSYQLPDKLDKTMTEKLLAEKE